MQRHRGERGTCSQQLTPPLLVNLHITSSGPLSCRGVQEGMVHEYSVEPQPLAKLSVYAKHGTLLSKLSTWDGLGQLHVVENHPEKHEHANGE